MTSPSRTGGVRSFRETDIPDIARLHHAVFRPEGRDGPAPLDLYRPYFSRIFLDSPLCDPSLPSLVYEEDGRIVGFVGIVARRMTMNGRRFLAALSSQFVVDPSCPVGLVAVRLARAYLEGPQDLSISDEASDISCRIWQGLGGNAAVLLSLHWTRPLRPARLAVDLLRNRKGLATLAATVRPLAGFADALAARLPASHLHQAPPPTSSTDLRVESVIESWPRFSDAQALRVEYDETTLNWLLARAAGRRGRLLKAVVRDGDRELGWYLCHLNGDGVADLLHLAATPTSMYGVFDHLSYEAWRAGAVALAGRLEPRFVQALSDRYCLFHRRGPWLMVHSRRPELLEAFLTGTACFSRLDGEWSLRFSP